MQKYKIDNSVLQAYIKEYYNKMPKEKYIGWNNFYWTNLITDWDKITEAHYTDGGYNTKEQFKHYLEIVDKMNYLLSAGVAEELSIEELNTNELQAKKGFYKGQSAIEEAAINAGYVRYKTKVIELKDSSGKIIKDKDGGALKEIIEIKDLSNYSYFTSQGEESGGVLFYIYKKEGYSNIYYGLAEADHSPYLINPVPLQPIFYTESNIRYTNHMLASKIDRIVGKHTPSEIISFIEDSWKDYEVEPIIIEGKPTFLV